MEKAAKQKDCEIIGEWKKSVINHLYWSAMSTEDGNGEMIVEKWLSVLNHMHDQHTGHGQLYTECAHGPLPNRKWLKYRKS